MRRSSAAPATPQIPLRGSAVDRELYCPLADHARSLTAICPFAFLARLEELPAIRKQKHLLAASRVLWSGTLTSNRWAVRVNAWAGGEKMWTTRQGFPPSPQNEALNPHLIQATQLAYGQGLWAGATLYFSALGPPWFSPLLVWMGLCCIVTIWSICNESTTANAHLVILQRSKQFLRSR